MNFSQERLRKEQEEKEQAEAHLYRIIKVARDEDLVEQIGRHIYFDLVDHDKVRSFRIQKKIPFNLFKEEVAKEFGIPVQLQRFWLWAKRRNHTYRPIRRLTLLEETQTVGQLREVSNKAHNAELKLFLEVELGLDLRPIAPPDKTKEDILLFFKLYDPEKEELRYVGRLFVKSTGTPMEYLAKLNEMAGYAPDEEIKLYEEIMFEPSVMCVPIEKIDTFQVSELEDGDIVCFQKSHTVESAEQYRYPNVPSFLDYVHNRWVVHFRSLLKPKEDDFCLELSKLFTYDDVVERVAQKLNLDDPSKIRLTSHNCYSQQPNPQPIKYRGIDHLTDMLIHDNQTSDILYYEVLDIPLPELQSLKFLKVAFHPAIKDEVELSHPDAELRLLEIFYHKIYKNLEGPEKETPAGKKGAEEATKSRSEVIVSLTKLGENFNHQVEQIGLQNILENPAAALELSKRLRSPGIKDLRNDSSDELMASMPSEVSVRDKVVLYAFLRMLESRMSNLSAEVALSSIKLAEAEAKLKSYESSEVVHNSIVESLEAELIKKQAENEALKNQAIASEQKAFSSEQKALFLQAENEVLKNQAIASEQKASSSEQKALFLARTILKQDKYSKDLSDAASKLIEDSSGSGKSKD